MPRKYVRKAKRVTAKPEPVMVTEKKRTPVRVREREPDILAVQGKEPGKEYRWVRMDDGAVRIDRAKMMGYTPVKENEIGLEKAGDATTGADGIVRRGNMILMKTDAEDYRERKEDERVEREASLKRAKERLAEDLRRAGGGGMEFGEGVRIREQ